MKILVTGAAGYIGSHLCVGLVERGFEVVMVDDLSEGRYTTIQSIHTLTQNEVPFWQIDLKDFNEMKGLMKRTAPDAVFHLAGFKSASQSFTNPVGYFNNNVIGTANLLESMRQAGIEKLVFSSSASIYDPHTTSPIKEVSNLAPISPYGASKKLAEVLIGEYSDTIKAVNLRFFNPIGAHPSGLLKDSSRDNIIPTICRVLQGEISHLPIYGDDWGTIDGTQIRDYVHILDLVEAHIQSLDYLVDNRRSISLNLGTGLGVSVLELIAHFEKVAQARIPYQVVERRLGDTAELYTDPSLAKKVLGWTAQRSIDIMCRDAFNANLMK